MIFLQKFLPVFITLASFNKILVKSEPDWTYDIIDVKVENHTPDIIFIDLHVSRPSRGIFAVSGYVDIKEDLTDDFLISINLYYSMSGGLDFTKTPFFIPESNTTEALNKYYKELAMESISKCATNAPWTDDKFEVPLPKRLATLDNCILSNKNMPSKMKSGYYKLLIKYRKRAEGIIEILVKVEQI